MIETGLRAALGFSAGAFSLEVNLSVPPGETLVLMGPNGAGKTTCLDLIAGLARPDRGRVALDGAVLFDRGAGTDLPPERRSVGLLFQDDALFPHLTARENVAYGLRARGLDGAEKAADRWLDRLGLLDAADRPATRLSGGQKKRVALARALAAGARLLLLDEPFASLDAATRSSVRARMRGFLKEAGLPAVVTAHDPVDAFVVGDRIAVLEGGRLVQAGTEAELLARPKTPFVAELAGLNFYRATVAAGSGLKEARAGEAVFHVLAEGLAGPAHLAFGPSEVSLSAQPPRGSPQNAFPGVVRDLVPLTDRLRVVLDGPPPLAADVTREAARQLGLAPGAKVWASVKATAIRVYP